MYRIYPLNEVALELEDRYREFLSTPQGHPFHILKITHDLEVQTGPVERNFHNLIINIPTQLVPTTFIVDQLPCLYEWHQLILAYMNDHLNSVLGWTPRTTKLKAMLGSIFPTYVDDDVTDYNRRLAITLLEEKRLRLLERQRELHVCASTPYPMIDAAAYRRIVEPQFLTEGNMILTARVVESGKKAWEQEIQWRESIQRKQHDTARELQGVDHRLMVHKAGGPTPEVLKASEAFYVTVIAPIQEKIIDWIDDAMGDDEETQWKIWYLRTVGMDVMLEDGPDFRVVDWTNRMQSGEWKREKTSHILDV